MNGATRLALILALVAFDVIGTAGAGDELPTREAGLWELVKNVVDDPRPLPAMRQCTDEKTDRALGANAYLASYDPCSKLKVTRTGEQWRIESVCESMAGPMTGTTLLSGDFTSSYRMEQTTTVMGETVRQILMAHRVGDCERGQKPGEIYINGMGFNLLDTNAH